MIGRTLQKFNGLFEFLLKLLRVCKVQGEDKNILMEVHGLWFSRKKDNTCVFEVFDLIKDGTPDCP
jgi:hypothetical protein